MNVDVSKVFAKGIIDNLPFGDLLTLLTETGTRWNFDWSKDYEDASQRRDLITKCKALVDQNILQYPKVMERSLYSQQRSAAWGQNPWLGQMDQRSSIMGQRQDQSTFDPAFVQHGWGNSHAPNNWSQGQAQYNNWNQPSTGHNNWRQAAPARYNFRQSTTGHHNWNQEQVNNNWNQTQNYNQGSTTRGGHTRGTNNAHRRQSRKARKKQKQGQIQRGHQQDSTIPAQTQRQTDTLKETTPGTTVTLSGLEQSQNATVTISTISRQTHDLTVILSRQPNGQTSSKQSQNPPARGGPTQIPTSRAQIQHPHNSRAQTQNPNPNARAQIQHPHNSRAQTRNPNPNARAQIQHPHNSRAQTQHTNPNARAQTQHPHNSRTQTQHTNPNARAQIQHPHNSRAQTQNPNPNSRTAEPTLQSQGPSTNLSGRLGRGTITSLPVRTDSSSSCPFQNISKPPIALAPVPTSSLMNLRMRPLPFYDILRVLLQPTLLLGTELFPVHDHHRSSTPLRSVHHFSSIEAIKESQVEILIRFFGCDSSSNQEQFDLYPPGLTVTVNNLKIHSDPQLQDAHAKHVQATPIPLFSYSKHNTIEMTWLPEGAGKNYAVSVYLTKKLTAKYLLERLKLRGVLERQRTVEMIRKITFSSDNDVCAPTSIRASIACPIGKQKMGLPCRSTTCVHPQCFDAEAYLFMQEKKPFRFFKCPVCDKTVSFEDFRIDGYFSEIRDRLAPDAGHNINLHPDGTWTPAQNDLNNASSTRSKSSNITINLDDEDEIQWLNDDDDDDLGGCVVASENANDVDIIELGPSSLPTSNQPVEPVPTTSSEPEVVNLDSSDDAETGEEIVDDSSDCFSSPPRNVSQKRAKIVSNSSDSSSNDGDKCKVVILKRNKRFRRLYFLDESSDSDSG